MAHLNDTHEAVVSKITETLLERCGSQMKSTQYRNFPNSLIHRQKHRTWAAMLVLQPVIAQVMQQLYVGKLARPSHED